MKNISFSVKALDEYRECAKTDKKKFNKINELIDSMIRTPFTGIGKPEPLKHEFAGHWSRRINDTDRIIYTVTDKNEIHIISCKGHYD